MAKKRAARLLMVFSKVSPNSRIGNTASQIFGSFFGIIEDTKKTLNQLTITEKVENVEQAEKVENVEKVENIENVENSFLSKEFMKDF